MSTESFKKAFSNQLQNGSTKLYFGHRFVRNGKQRTVEIMQIKPDELEQLAEQMKNAVEDNVRVGVLPWFTTNE